MDTAQATCRTSGKDVKTFLVGKIISLVGGFYFLFLTILSNYQSAINKEIMLLEELWVLNEDFGINISKEMQRSIFLEMDYSKAQN